MERGGQYLRVSGGSTAKRLSA